MENNFNVKDLFDLKGIMKLFNTTDIKDVVALEKKLINFLTNEQLEEIAKYEKEILNDLMNSKNSLEDLRGKYGKLVDKLASIGINANDIINPPHQVEHNEEEKEEDELPERVNVSLEDLGIDVEEDNIDDVIEEHIEEYLDDTYGVSADDYKYYYNEDSGMVDIYDIEWS